MLLLALVSLAHAAPADCPSPAKVADLQAKLDAAEADAEGTAENIGRLVGEVRASVPCLGEIAPPSLAAQLHRMVGLEAGRTDELAGLPAFMAARSIEPDAPLTPSGILAKSGLGQTYQSVDTTQVAWEDLAAAAEGTLRSDGRTPARRAADLPVLLQLETPDGVAWTRYLTPGEATPDYAVAEAAPVATTEAPAATTPQPLPPAPKPRKGGAALRWSGLGTALAGGVVYGLAAMELKEHNDNSTSISKTEFHGYQSRVNGMSAGGVTGMVLGAGLFGLSFTVGG